VGDVEWKERCEDSQCVLPEPLLWFKRLDPLSWTAGSRFTTAGTSVVIC
jgi:hypothetical protein